jgi:hypothetical protein
MCNDIEAVLDASGSERVSIVPTLKKLGMSRRSEAAVWWASNGAGK